MSDIAIKRDPITGLYYNEPIETVKEDTADEVKPEVKQPLVIKRIVK